MSGQHVDVVRTVNRLSSNNNAVPETLISRDAGKQDNKAPCAGKRLIGAKDLSRSVERKHALQDETKSAHCEFN